MNALDFISYHMSWLPKTIAKFLEKGLKKIPAVQQMIAQENDKLMENWKV